MHGKLTHTIGIILIALALFLVLKTVAVDIKQVDGHSMEPAFLPGQFVLINKLEYGLIVPIINTYLIRWKKPAVGDVVAVRQPDQQKIVIKRCVAKGGDGIYPDKHYLVVNNRQIPWGESYTKELFAVAKVPDDKIIIIGDNYYNSIDSRYFGFVPETDVLGKVIKLKE